jgi:hypothetical protein
MNKKELKAKKNETIARKRKIKKRKPILKSGR